MSIRREPTYLSTEVWRCLYLLSKRENHEFNSLSPDAIADQLLHDLIKERYPQLFEHQKKIEEMEKELMKELQ